MAQRGVSRVLFLGKHHLGDEKQKNMKRAGHVLSKRTTHTGLLVNVLKEINNSEYLGAEWSIILKWVKVFYLPTDAQKNYFKKNIKIYINVSVQSPSSGSALFELAKVTVVKIIN